MIVYRDNERGLTVRPLTLANWQDFEYLLGERGACGGCWCMAWRHKKAEFESCKGERNKQAMKDMVERGATVGVLGYVEGKVAGWCSIAPREQFIRLQYSRNLQPIDYAAVWSIVCIYLDKRHRRQGFSTSMINGAVEYCKMQGGSIVEGYPATPYDDKMPSAFLWCGVPVSDLKAGFEIAAQPSRWKNIVRRYIYL